MAKIKVLHLTYDMRIGGTEMVIKNIIEGSDPTRFEMSIFCIEEPLGPWGNELLAQGVAITTKARSPGFDTSLIKAIRSHLKRYAIDVIHCHQYTPWVYGVIAGLGLKCKVVFTEHGRFYPDTSSWKRKLINPWLARVTDSIMAISEATKQALVAFENIPENRIGVVYNGIESPIVNSDKVETLREQLGLSPINKVLGTIARFDPIKNHPMMLKAFAEVVETIPNSTLIIVGDGEERETITAKIKELNLESKVILTGYEPKPQHYLALMDVFLLSSLSEGTSMTLLEAMSLSKPCVVTNVGGNPEIITHGKNGYVCESGNAKEMATQAIKLLEEKADYERKAKASLERYLQLFTCDSMTLAYADIYLNLNGDSVAQ